MAPAPATDSLDGSPLPGMLPRDQFIRILSVERRRTERSGRRFALMLLDLGALRGRAQVPAKAITAVTRCTRDTDIMGWYEESRVMGGIFTELGQAEPKLAVNTIIFGLNGAVSEGLVLAERAGIDRATAYDVIAASAVGAPFVQYKRSAFVDPLSTAPAACRGWKNPRS